MMRPIPTVPRYPDWPERLAALIEERRHTPFAWGTQDCCSFAADAMQALTGRDPMGELRNSYSDAAGAEALIGPNGLEALIADRLVAAGALDCPAEFVQRGDLALVLLGNELAGGVVLAEVVAAPGLRGLEFLPPTTIQRAWSV